MDILEILHKIGYTDLQDLGKEYRVRPLYRPSDNKTSLCIKKSTGQWYDFSERRGGQLPQLIQLTLQLASIADAGQYLGDFIAAPNKRHAVELSEVKKFDKTLLSKLVKNHEYWIKRNISEETIKIFEGGITHNGRMRNRYVFPIFNDRDELIGFSGRLLEPNDNMPKWKHLGSKTNWCYPLKWNAHILSTLKEVVLVESIGDMVSLWDAGIKNVLVTFGVEVSPKIIEFFLRIDAQRIVVAFNNDIDNNFVGNEAAEEAKENLLKFFDPQQVNVALPELNDFGEMNHEQIKLWKEKFQIKNS